MHRAAPIRRRIPPALAAGWRCSLSSHRPPTRSPRSERGDGRVRHARRRHVVRRSDDRPAADVRADVADRSQGHVRHAADLPGRRHPATPWLARSWTVSKDAKTFTFKLRRDVRFSDGTPLTSADVVFSYRRRDQPQGLAVLPARGRQGLGPERVHGRAAFQTPNPALLRDRAEPLARHRQLEGREGERRHRRRRRRQDGQGRAVPAPHVRRLGAVRAEELQQQDADRPRREPALLGAEAERSRRS